MLVKLYGHAPDKGPECKFPPAECIGTCKARIEGNLDLSSDMGIA